MAIETHSELGAVDSGAGRLKLSRYHHTANARSR
jgi:hypothetical protein